MFGKTYTHTQVSRAQAEIIEEIAVIDALRVGMIVAQLRAGEAGLAPDWLDRFDAFLSNRKRGLVCAIEGVGVIYRDRAGAIRPVMVAASDGGGA